MKIFSWMQTKLDRRGPEKQKKPCKSSSLSVQCRPPTRKEEFSDWPEILLAIGTFGNKKPKEEEEEEGGPLPKHNNSQSPPQGDISIEEVTKLTKDQLTKPKTATNGAEKGSEDDQTLDRLLKSLSMSLEVNRSPGNDNDDVVDISTDAKTVLNKAKDMPVDKKGGIRERSVSFLLKKMFVCHSGFAPTPSLKDPLTESRAEKIIRTVLHKKIYPQSTLQPLAKKMLEKQAKKTLGRRREEILWSEEEKTERGVHQNKWVKTDSEYFVLEIERAMP